MCQELPGPRCASHTKTALDAARTRRTAAETAVQHAITALETARANGATLATSVDEHAALAHARQDLDSARAAYTTALAEYQSTPTGMDDLRAAIDRLRAAGDTAAVEQAEAALDAAVTTRAQQVRDLTAFRAQRARLDAATPDEQAALAAADAKVADADEVVAEATERRDALDREAEAIRGEYERTQNEGAAARSLVVSANTAVEAAAPAVVAEARRLYLAAGVSERMASFYTADMVTTAREKSPAAGARDGGPITKALKVKIKRNGADRDATLAAAEASQTDPGFIAANRRLGVALDAARQARQHASEISREDVEPVATAYLAASGKAMRAQYEVEDAITARDKAQADAHLLRARVGAGMGTDGGESLPLSRVRDEVVRNPDGTTNAFVYRAPSPGFPHGRMAAVVDVSTVRGWSAANALVLEDGTTISASEHYYRGRSGAQVDRRNERIHLMPAQDGATPLRAENHAEAGFTSFVDSTD